MSKTEKEKKKIFQQTQMIIYASANRLRILGFVKIVSPSFLISFFKSIITSSLTVMSHSTTGVGGENKMICDSKLLFLFSFACFFIFVAFVYLIFVLTSLQWMIMER
jgi:hypothetical protein